MQIFQLYISVSGVKIGEFVCGRPYGGCAILYRSSFSPCITPLNSTSNRFCALKIQDNSGTSILLVNVYMPSQSSLSDYLDTLGVLEGFIESYQCDVSVIVGDFNVDFNRDNASANYLSMFMASSDLVACSIRYTYERDSDSVRSWIDHILCNGSHSHLISQVCPINSGVNFSDHLPISFVLALVLFVSPLLLLMLLLIALPPLLLCATGQRLSNAILMSIGFLFQHLCPVYLQILNTVVCQIVPNTRMLDGIVVLNNLGPRLTFGTRYGLKLVVHLMGFCPRLKREALSMLYGKSEGSKVMLANVFSHKSSKDFWASVKRMTRRKTSDSFYY